jgi:ubiquinone/menaquinone biosynthesis C-methylase UbiE
MFFDNLLEERDIRLSGEEDKYTAEVLQKANIFTSAKAALIKNTLRKYDLYGGSVLHVGCGGILHKRVSDPYLEAGFTIVGLDIHETYLKEFQSEVGAPGVFGNAIHLPFDENSFDIVNYTDILEHLIDPVQALNEVSRVLKDKGFVIITTHNRHSGKLFRKNILNPLYFGEQILGLYMNNILVPHFFIDRWMNFDFYHTEFTKKELEALLENSGFAVVEFCTKSLTIDLNIFKRSSRRLLGFLPIFKWLINPFFILARCQK